MYKHISVHCWTKASLILHNITCNSFYLTKQNFFKRYLNRQKQIIMFCQHQITINNDKINIYLHVCFIFNFNKIANA